MPTTTTTGQSIRSDTSGALMKVSKMPAQDMSRLNNSLKALGVEAPPQGWIANRQGTELVFNPTSIRSYLENDSNENISTSLALSGRIRLSESGELEIAIRNKDEDIATRLVAFQAVRDLLPKEVLASEASSMEAQYSELTFCIRNPPDLQHVVNALTVVDLVGKIQHEILEVNLNSRITGNLNNRSVIRGERAPPEIPFIALERAEAAVEILLETSTGPYGAAHIRKLEDLLACLKNQSLPISDEQRSAARIVNRELHDAIQSGDTQLVSEIIADCAVRVDNLKKSATLNAVD